MMPQKGEDFACHFSGGEERIKGFFGVVLSAHGGMGALGDDGVDEEMGALFGEALREVDDGGFGAGVDGKIGTASGITRGGDVHDVGTVMEMGAFAAVDKGVEIGCELAVDF